MKYIRTKDGHIYKTSGQDKNHPRYYNIANANLEIDALGIIKQANTIEELCDDFISGERLICKSRLKQTCEMLLKEKAEVYGAIWTDKGLIYVAKMNEKGELELL